MSYSLDADARRSVRARLFGDKMICSCCGERDPIALVFKTSPVLCATCEAIESGRSPNEDHHPLGRANARCTIEIPATLHRRFTNLQYDWPVRTLTNPDGERLVRWAAGARFASDTFILFAQWAQTDLKSNRLARWSWIVASVCRYVAEQIEQGNVGPP